NIYLSKLNIKNCYHKYSYGASNFISPLIQNTPWLLLSTRISKQKLTRRKQMRRISSEIYSHKD
ncbi:unnamed protein product, partial [Allacma fusca]